MVFYLCGYDDPVEVAKQRMEKADADVEQEKIAELKEEAEKARVELETLTSKDVVFITNKEPDALLPGRWPSRGSSLEELIFTDRRDDQRK